MSQNSNSLQSNSTDPTALFVLSPLTDLLLDLSLLYPYIRSRPVVLVSRPEERGRSESKSVVTDPIFARSGSVVMGVPLLILRRQPIIIVISDLFRSLERSVTSGNYFCRFRLQTEVPPNSVDFYPVSNVYNSDVYDV